MSHVVVAEARIGKEHYKTEISIRQHQLLGDEPLDNGGQDLGPSPFEYILSGLATCTLATLRMYADRKEMDLEGVDIKLSLHVEKNGLEQVTYIERELTVHGNISEEQRKRLVEIADKCPVHKMLTHETRIVAKLAE